MGNDKSFIALTLILAILATLFAPSYKAKAPDGSYIEICTAYGIQYIKIDSPPLDALAANTSEDKSNQTPHEKSKGNCPFCLNSYQKAYISEVIIIRPELSETVVTTLVHYDIVTTRYIQTPPSTGPPVLS